MRSHQLRTIIACTTAILLLMFFVVPDDALAGPGGEIVEAVFKSKIGRIVMGILAIILLPLIIYVYVRQALGIRKTRRDLEALSQKYPYFAWKPLEVQVRRLAQRLYGAWTGGDLSGLTESVTCNFVESQQAILDRWTEEGRRNVTRLKKIRKIRPLFVGVENEYRDSTVSVMLSIDLVDYLEKVSSKKVIKGSTKVQEDEDVIFNMIYDGESGWLLHAIEDGDNSLIMASESNSLDTSYLDRLPTAGRLATAVPEEVPERHPEEPPVSSEDEHSREQKG